MTSLGGIIFQCAIDNNFQVFVCTFPMQVYNQQALKNVLTPLVMAGYTNMVPSCRQVDILK